MLIGPPRQPRLAHRSRGTARVVKFRLLDAAGDTVQMVDSSRVYKDRNATLTNALDRKRRKMNRYWATRGNGWLPRGPCTQAARFKGALRLSSTWHGSAWGAVPGSNGTDPQTSLSTAQDTEL